MSASIASVIDSVVHGQQSILSFRQLSTLSSVSLVEAQSQLSSYVSKEADKLNILWHVTETSNLITKTTLTTKPPSSYEKKKVWAIAPSDISIDPSSAWFSYDHESVLEQSSEPSHSPNALRDGRFLPIVSTTAAWDTRPDPRLGKLTGQPSVNNSIGMSKSNKRFGSSLLSAVKQSQKRNSTLPSKSNNSQSNPNNNNSLKKRPLNNSNNNNSNSTPKSSLFSSKKLGQDATNRIKAKQKTQSNSSNTSQASKKRRIIALDDEEDDDEDDFENKGLSNQLSSKKNDPFEDDDDEDSLTEIERKAMAKERSEEERAEIERELRELSNENDDDQQPESPVLKDVDDEAEVEKELGIDEKEAQRTEKKKESGKSFRESFGMSEPVKGPRRIRKEVEVTEEGDDGYIITRRVTKTFDENGNEIKDDPTVTSKDSNQSTDENKNENKNSASPPMSCLPGRTSGNGLKKKNSNNNSSGGLNGHNSKKGTGGKTKGSQKIGGKSKKKKGNIMSYFSKKT